MLEANTLLVLQPEIVPYFKAVLKKKKKRALTLVVTITNVI